MCKSKQPRYFAKSPHDDLTIDRSLLQKSCELPHQNLIVHCFLPVSLNINTCGHFCQWRNWTTIQEKTLKIY